MMTDVFRRWLLLFALLMRIIVPSGFMLDAAAAAHPTLVACDGRGSVFGVSSHHGAHHDRHHGNHSGASDHGDCPYSAAASAADKLADIPDMAAIAPPGLPSTNVWANHLHRPLAAAAAPPPSTGPPSVA